MMNRRTLRKFRSPNDTKKFNENKSCHLSYFSHAIKFERLGTPHTGIPAKLITPNLGGLLVIVVYTVGSPQGFLFNHLEETNQTEMYFGG